MNNLIDYVGNILTEQDIRTYDSAIVRYIKDMTPQEIAKAIDIELPTQTDMRKAHFLADLEDSGVVFYD